MMGASNVRVALEAHRGSQCRGPPVWHKLLLWSEGQSILTKKSPANAEGTAIPVTKNAEGPVYGWGEGRGARFTACIGYSSSSLCPAKRNLDQDKAGERTAIG